MLWVPFTSLKVIFEKEISSNVWSSHQNTSDKKKGPLFSSWRWNKQNSPAAHLHVEQRRQQLQKSIICSLVGSPYYHSSFSALSRWLPANTLHPQRPPSQRFVNFWQLFFLLFFFLLRLMLEPLPLTPLPPYPWRMISPGVMAAEACKIPPLTPQHCSPWGTSFYQEGRKRKRHWIMNESQSAIHLSSSDTADINAVSVPDLPAI